MLERPHLADDALIDALARHYAVQATAISFLPIGNDATAWAFRAMAEDGHCYFLKLKRGPVYAPALTVPRFLAEQGITAVVAPLVSRNGDLWNAVSGFALAVYPFVAGSTGMEAGLSPSQWTALGAILRKIHAFGPQSARLTDVRHESFRPAWLDTVQAIQARVDDDEFANPISAAFAAEWRAHAPELQRICARAAELGRITAARNLPRVLCHTDIHTANVLVDPQGHLHIVDWDQPLFAPKERDLMFFVAAEQDAPRIHPHFDDGYNADDIDWAALAYYRYEWAVQEFGDYGMRVFHGDSGHVTRAEAVRSFRQLFDPGDVIDGAYQAEGWIN